MYVLKSSVSGSSHRNVHGYLACALNLSSICCIVVSTAPKSESSQMTRRVASARLVNGKSRR